MSFITGLLGSLWPYIIAAVGGLLALWQYGRTQKKAGINEQKAKEAAARAENLKRIQAAGAAGARVQPDDPGMHDDPFNRDNR